MKQQCPMVNVYLGWIVYLGMLGYLIYRSEWILAWVYVVLVPVSMWSYVHFFPKMSRFMGYGVLDDKPALNAGPSAVKVNFYTALGCPFCPVVEQRLLALQKQSGFSIEKIDVTLRPGLLAGKGIRAVPVVEVGDSRLVGHATTEQLSQLIHQA